MVRRSMRAGRASFCLRLLGPLLRLQTAPVPRFLRDLPEGVFEMNPKLLSQHVQLADAHYMCGSGFCAEEGGAKGCLLKQHYACGAAADTWQQHHVAQPLPPSSSRRRVDKVVEVAQMVGSADEAALSVQL